MPKALELHLMTARIQLDRHTAVRVLYLDNRDEATEAPDLGANDLKVLQEQAVARTRLQRRSFERSPM